MHIRRPSSLCRRALKQHMGFAAKGAHMQCMQGGPYRPSHTAQSTLGVDILNCVLRWQIPQHLVLSRPVVAVGMRLAGGPSSASISSG